MSWDEQEQWIDDEPFVETRVFVTRWSWRYHDEHSGKKPWRWFATSREAREAGYLPCGTCRPT